MAADVPVTPRSLIGASLYLDQWPPMGLYSTIYPWIRSPPSYEGFAHLRLTCPFATSVTSILLGLSGTATIIVQQIISLQLMRQGLGSVRETGLGSDRVTGRPDTCSPLYLTSRY